MSVTRRSKPSGPTVGTVPMFRNMSRSCYDWYGADMSPLPNSRHEHFATLVAGGMSATEAYTTAGFIGKGTAPSACRLSKKSAVAARIAELRRSASSAAVSRAAVDRGWVLAGLKKIAETSKNDNAQVRALELCGKELGMFCSHASESFEWDGDPASLNSSQLAKLTALFEAIAREQTQQESADRSTESVN